MLQQCSGAAEESHATRGMDIHATGCDGMRWDQARPTEGVTVQRKTVEDSHVVQRWDGARWKSWGPAGVWCRESGSCAEGWKARWRLERSHKEL